MGRIGITEDDVHRAADWLYQEHGSAPKNKDVSERLGTGSDSTITKYMQTWRANNALDLASVRHKTSIVKSLSALLDDLESKVRLEYTARIERLMQVNSTQLHDIELHAERNNKLSDDLSQKQLELDELGLRFTNQEGELIALKESNSRLAAQVKEVALINGEREKVIQGYKAESAEWKKDRDELKEQIKSESNRCEALHEQNKSLASQVNYKDEELKAGQAREDSLKQTITELKEHHKMLIDHQHTSEIGVAKLRSENSTLLDQLRDRLINQSRIEQENAVLKERNVLSGERLTELQNQIDMMVKASARESELIKALQEQLAYMSTKKISGKKNTEN